MRVLIYEYNPRPELWFLKRERKVVELTDHSVCINEGFLKRRIWYPLKPVGMRFEFIKDNENE
jgi:hypothetical protein